MSDRRISNAEWLMNACDLNALHCFVVAATAGVARAEMQGDAWLMRIILALSAACVAMAAITDWAEDITAKNRASET